MHVAFRATVKPGKEPVSCLPWGLCDEGFSHKEVQQDPPPHIHTHTYRDIKFRLGSPMLLKWQMLTSRSQDNKTSV